MEARRRAAKKKKLKKMGKSKSTDTEEEEEEDIGDDGNKNVSNFFIWFFAHISDSRIWLFLNYTLVLFLTTIL